MGLTGGIASGKSTVSAILSELGAVVIDSDRLAREVVAPGSPGLAQVVEAFGPEVLTADGEMDRPKVGSIVFADPEKRRVLESIIWPLVARRSEELVAQGGPEALVVHDIPLLVESGQQDGFDAIVVVDAPHDVQLERMVRDRGMSIEDAEDRIAFHQNSIGGVAGPFDSWLTLRGLKTLAVRMERAQANAGVLAQRLAEHPQVSRVRYPGLPDDPGHAIATRDHRGFGAMISFEVSGGAAAAERVCTSVRLINAATSLGGVESLIERRAMHAGDEAMGTPAGLLRFSVGIEHVEDLWADLAPALAAV